MKLEKLAQETPSVRQLMSWVVVGYPKYLEAVEKGLPFFTAEELTRIEKSEDYKNGLTVKQIDRILSEKGMIVKLPTFKKYVNLGLIPASTKRRRTGKGSAGLYPANVIRTINLIKYCLYANVDSFDAVVGDFKITALRLVEDSLEDGCLGFIEFLYHSWSDPRFKDEPQVVIKRIAQLLLEQEVIGEEKMNEVVETTDRVTEALYQAETTFFELQDLLKGIELTGTLGLLISLLSVKKRQNEAGHVERGN